jgi:tRNA wybutosine-synthesizing protein 2
MTFNDKLRNKLENNFSEEELRFLPKGYQIVGSILLIKLNKNLMKHKKIIGEKIIEILPYIKTVCLIKEIKKTIRKPEIEIIAGLKKTQTLNKEHGCKFLLDVSDIMWSQGNKNEKMRLAKMVRPGEIIVDMFAGIGYFSIILANYCKPKKIYAIDINPKAIEYLRKNAWLNEVEDKIEILQGDCRKFSKPLENTADRVIMGYLFNTEKFLSYALKIAKDNAVIHFHRTVKEEEIDKFKEKLIKIGIKNKVKIRVLKIKKVKSYAPKIWHVVFDLRVTKRWI